MEALKQMLTAFNGDDTLHVALSTTTYAAVGSMRYGTLIQL